MRAKEHLHEHREGVGKLFVDGDRMVPVRYVLDTWLQAIATGSGTSSNMKRLDGFIWWETSGTQPKQASLEIEDGTRFSVTLSDIRPNRASFYCVNPDSARKAT